MSVDRPAHPPEAGECCSADVVRVELRRAIADITAVLTRLHDTLGDPASASNPAPGPVASPRRAHAAAHTGGQRAADRLAGAVDDAEPGALLATLQGWAEQSAEQRPDPLTGGLPHGAGTVPSRPDMLPHDGARTSNAGGSPSNLDTSGQATREELATADRPVPSADEDVFSRFVTVRDDAPFLPVADDSGPMPQPATTGHPVVHPDRVNDVDFSTHQPTPEPLDESRELPSAGAALGDAYGAASGTYDDTEARGVDRGEDAWAGADGRGEAGLPADSGQLPGNEAAANPLAQRGVRDVQAAPGPAGPESSHATPGQAAPGQPVTEVLSLAQLQATNGAAAQTDEVDAPVPADQYPPVDAPPRPGSAGADVGPPFNASGEPRRTESRPTGDQMEGYGTEPRHPEPSRMRGYPGESRSAQQHPRQSHLAAGVRSAARERPQRSGLRRRSDAPDASPASVRPVVDPAALPAFVGQGDSGAAVPVPRSEEHAVTGPTDRSPRYLAANPHHGHLGSGNDGVHQGTDGAASGADGVGTDRVAYGGQQTGGHLPDCGSDQDVGRNDAAPVPVHEPESLDLQDVARIPRFLTDD